MGEHRVIHTGVDFGEGPRWHDGRLWFSDMHARQVVSLGDDGARVELETDDQPSGLGWLSDGTLLVVSMQAQKLLAVSPSGEVREHADLSGVASFHCNDMVVSADGHAYVGNMGFDFAAQATPEPAFLAHVAPDGTVRRVDHPLMFPNGAVISPDGSTLIVGETFGGQYTAFTLDADGHPTEPRVWAAIEGSTPDGCAIDAEGAIWMADFLGQRFARVHADGSVSDEFTVDNNAVCCALGGPDRRTLYYFVSPGSGPDLAGQGLSWIGAVEVDVPGAGQP